MGRGPVTPSVRLAGCAPRHTWDRKETTRRADPRRCTIRLCVRFRDAIHLPVPSDHGHRTRPLLHTVGDDSAHERRLYLQAGHRRRVSAQPALLWLERDDHRAWSAFSADVSFWLIQRPPRVAMDVRRFAFLSGIGNGLYRLPAPLGSEGLLCHGRGHQRHWRDAHRRQLAPTPGARRGHYRHTDSVALLCCPFLAYSRHDLAFHRSACAALSNVWSGGRRPRGSRRSETPRRDLLSTASATRH